MAAGPVELPASAAAALGNFGMHVSPANILGLYAVVMEEITGLELSLMNFQMRHQGVRERVFRIYDLLSIAGITFRVAKASGDGGPPLEEIEDYLRVRQPAGRRDH
jgi:hypothetical protein